MRFINKVEACIPYNPVFERRPLERYMYWGKRLLTQNEIFKFVNTWFEISNTLYSKSNKERAIEHIKNYQISKANYRKDYTYLYKVADLCYYLDRVEGAENASYFHSVISFTTIQHLSDHNLECSISNYDYYNSLIPGGVVSYKESFLYNLAKEHHSPLSLKNFRKELLNGGILVPKRYSNNEVTWVFNTFLVREAFYKWEMVLEYAEQERHKKEYLEEVNYIRDTGKVRITHLF